MAPKQSDSSSSRKSTGKTKKQSKKQKTSNSINVGDNNNISMSSLEHDESNHNNSMPGFQVNGDHLSTPSLTTHQVLDPHQGGYQNVVRPWEARNLNGNRNDNYTTDNNTINIGYNNRNVTNYNNTSSSMNHWLQEDANDQPWHGIAAVYVDVEARGYGTEQRCYGGVEREVELGMDMDSMVAEDGSLEL
jgi:hypothetical protein